MDTPLLLAHISDPHVGADWAGQDPAERLAAAVRAIDALAPRPVAVLVSGDLAETGADAEDEQVGALMGSLVRARGRDAPPAGPDGRSGDGCDRAAGSRPARARRGRRAPPPGGAGPGGGPGAGPS